MNQESSPSHDNTKTPPWRIAADYHDRTKHHFHRYARSLGYMDWATQPHPFRRFDGAPLHPLPFPPRDDTPRYDELFAAQAVVPQPVNLATLSRLFFYSLALSAWKRLVLERPGSAGAGDSRWALRVNPSSGNLHPTEAYLIAGPIDGLNDAPAVYHYASDEHVLERRCDLQADAAGPGPGQIGVALTSVPWRESWKYGERAFRYCQHDVGHAVVALRLSAAMLGWRLQLAPSVGDDTIQTWIGLDRADASHDGEREVPDAWLSIDTRIADIQPLFRSAHPVRPRRWHGKANRLSDDHHTWEAIEVVERACRRPDRWSPPPPFDGGAPPSQPGRDVSAGQLVRRRRSAVAMDGKTGLTRDAFYRMLCRLLPGQPPFDALPWRPQVHLGLFVHRIEDLLPGVYVLVRQAEQVERVREAMNADSEWIAAPQAPAELPLFRLTEADARRVAAQVSCGQEIAGESAFSLGMLAWFEAPLRDFGACMYRHLFWETGMIGQMLYLEAEAAGVRGTGIGCFFDDPVHEIFGLRDHQMQSLYHFTVGGAIDDARLTTEPAYSESPVP